MALRHFSTVSAKIRQEFCGIWRDMAGYGGMWRDMAECGGIWRNIKISIFIDFSFLLNQNGKLSGQGILVTIVSIN